MRVHTHNCLWDGRVVLGKRLWDLWAVNEQQGESSGEKGEQGGYGKETRGRKTIDARNSSHPAGLPLMDGKCQPGGANGTAHLPRANLSNPSPDVQYTPDDVTRQC